MKPQTSISVKKFGGTSVGDIERIKNAAAKVEAEVRRGNKVADKPIKATSPEEVTGLITGAIHTA